MNEPIHILVVDDRRENLLAMEAMLDDPELCLITTTSGQGALEQCLEHDFALILLDVQMPGMDGFETAEYLRKTSRTRYIPIIFVTANSRDMKNLSVGYESGAVDYLFKPLNPEIVINKVRIFKELYQQRLVVQRKNEELAVAYRSMEADLDAAADIQRSMLPKRLPETDRVRAAWRFRPCQIIGGDLLNVAEPASGQLALYVLDVSGHGVQAALLSTALGHLLASVSRADSIVWNYEHDRQDQFLAPPGEVALRLNRRFPMDPDTCQYFTLIYGLLDPNNLVFTYVAAGHPQPFLVSGDEVKAGNVTNPPIGWIPELDSFSEGRLQLKPGDRMYLFSDGLTEAFSPEGEEFGVDRLVEQLRAMRSCSLADGLDRLEQLLLTWSDGNLQDDLTILAVEVKEDV